MSQAIEEGVVVVGAGCSSAVPILEHLFDDHIGKDGKPNRCKTCEEAADNPNSKNRRNNVSLLVKHRNGSVLVDVGKTFRTAALEVLRKMEPRARVQALLITHDHADAIMGLDDVRDLQRWERPRGADGVMNYKTDPLPIYLTQRTFARVKSCFRYIVDEAESTAPMRRKVAKLKFNQIDDSLPERDHEEHAQESTRPRFLAPKPGWDSEVESNICNADREKEKEKEEAGSFEFPVFEPVAGLRTTALPVWHGSGYLCLGFLFEGTDAQAEANGPPASEANGPSTKSEEGEKEGCEEEAGGVLYLSDVSAIPLTVLSYLAKRRGKLKLLLCDTLKWDRPHFSHFCAEEAMELAEWLQPEELILVGMDCSVDYEKSNERLASWIESRREAAEKEGGRPAWRLQKASLGFDGLSIPLSFTSR
uniref:Uncharacterized protein n=1 Tax=Chromera velia CCMP2878 TaxID=1169474 RepID=A0A0G4HPY7_9ALVE|eukprot:Cvel_30030.t1-p1 / transcript=Cvel_30030.t1 / gene=Cvel_30030 / organism=Chromera_velia_CCMP2878 / gene_product=Putative hydrolase C777.06c, putative / transcript_product=Putative hydrolase C777.06c, putative / location=Cvel_scaffold4218:4525-9985(-) / protein_length=419 / sequence_SO=supercontig / SO=protein_coding / is_pseudo=false